MPDSVPPPDLLAEAAALIRDVGLSAERARRYRALATSIAEPTFDRAVEIGSVVRRAGRAAEQGSATIVAALDELRMLLDRTEAAIADLRAAAGYREAAAAFANGDAALVAALASEIFTDVETFASSGVAAWKVPVGTERGDGEHFASPAACAERIAEVRSAGLRAAASPGLGGDDTITPIALTTDVEGADGPILLVYEAAALPGPLCRLTGGTVALFYAERLVAPFTVRCAETVTDEWWAVRPNAYAQWRSELEPLLRSQGLDVTSGT